MISTPTRQVVVVGAGPAGLLLALILAREGVTVSVLEANEKLDARPRALLYGPAASQSVCTFHRRPRPRCVADYISE